MSTYSVKSQYPLTAFEPISSQSVFSNLVHQSHSICPYCSLTVPCRLMPPPWNVFRLIQSVSVLTWMVSAPVLLKTWQLPVATQTSYLPIHHIDPLISQPFLSIPSQLSLSFSHCFLYQSHRTIHPLPPMSNCSCTLSIGWGILGPFSNFICPSNTWIPLFSPI